MRVWHCSQAENATLYALSSLYISYRLAAATWWDGIKEIQRIPCATLGTLGSS